MMLLKIYNPVMNPNYFKANKDCCFSKLNKMKRVDQPRQTKQIQMCKETYSGGFPLLFNTPAYNFF